MARIAITGASGNVGRAILPAFRKDHDVTAFSHSKHPDLETTTLDITDAAAVDTALADHDVVVHLAACTEGNDWEGALSINIDGTRNVFETASEGSVERVIFASTNNAVRMYNQDTAEGALDDHTEITRPDATPRPNSYYAISKAAGEAIANYFADCHGLEVVNLRIGWLDSETVRRKISEGDPISRYPYAMYLSERDCCDGLLKAATVDLQQNPLTVNLISKNQDRTLSIGEAMRQLNYEPKDDSREVFGPPEQ
jgi:L-arabinose 1-dehydrogenase [NAD(P)+]